MADVILLATGARPRELPSAVPDGERILTWQQLYTLDALPERLIVVGSGVTGAEFAGAYTALGSEVVLVSSRAGASHTGSRRGGGPWKWCSSSGEWNWRRRPGRKRWSAPTKG